MNILKVFAWIIGIVIGAVILLFVFFKIVNKNGSLGFQDFIIERVFGKGKSAIPANAPKPAPVVTPAIPPTIIPTPVTIPMPVTVPPPIVVPTPTPVPRPQNGDLLGSVSTFSPPAAQQVPRPVLTPIPPVVDPMAMFEPSAQSSNEEIPDWLKSTTDRLTSVPETPAVQAVPAAIEPVSRMAAEPVAPAIPTESELPSWLVGSNAVVETPVAPVPQPFAEPPATEVETPVYSSIQTEPADVAVDAVQPTPAPEPVSDDLPDWLKNFSPVPPQVSEPVPPSVPKDDDVFGDADTIKNFGFPPSAPVSENEMPIGESAPKEVAVKAPKPKKPKASTPLPEIQPTANIDDLPDWLK